MQTFTIQAAGREQVLAFRLEGHHLSTRLPGGSLLLAAGACGVQNTPPGSAALSLHARLANLTPEAVERGLVEDKTLLQAWSLRAAPHVFPTGEAAVFTAGLRPVDEETLRFFMQGADAALDKIGIRASEVVELSEVALWEALDGRELTKDQLGIELSGWVAQHLTPRQLSAWESPSWYSPNQSLGESVIRFALPILSLAGKCCHADRRGNQAYTIRTDQWLEAPIPEMSREQAQAELVRRYLHCYAPSTVEHFAAWAGIAPAQSAGMWKLIEDELVEINFDGRKTWLHGGDLPRWVSPAISSEAHFLPPHDPFLQLRDRGTLVPDKALQRSVWRHIGNPGVLLVEGQFVATWRSQKKGKRRKVSVESLVPISKGTRSVIEAEAATLAPYSDSTSVEVEFK